MEEGTMTRVRKKLCGLGAAMALICGVVSASAQEKPAQMNMPGEQVVTFGSFFIDADHKLKGS